MKKHFTLFSLLLLSSVFMYAQNLKLVEFSSGYTSPLGVENCGDNRLFIVQQDGRIFISDSNGNRLSRPYLDITDRVLFNGGEQGLLGLAFDPNYKKNGFFYVNYINKNGNTQISRFKVKADTPNVANKNSEKFILNITQPFSNHNGGCTRFGPDNYLYIGMGDGGSAGDPNNNAQNKQSLLGKMLRINVHSGDPYSIPSTNPFVDSTNYRPEIWALGLRNPWRWSFDALNGKMFIGDVGQDSWEEVDIQQKGKGGNNYGWRCYEGKHAYNTSGCKPQQSYYGPKYEYAHADSTGDCSITGGFVYRGSQYPNLYGKYIFADYCSGLFRLLYTEDGIGKVKVALNGDDYSYSSFGVDKNNEIYVCNLTNGKIYHVTEAGVNFSQTIGTPHNTMSIAPNPSHGNINIHYSSLKAAQVTIRVTGLLGNQVYIAAKNAVMGDNIFSINLNVPKGDYYLTISSADGSLVTQNLKID